MATFMAQRRTSGAVRAAILAALAVLAVAAGGCGGGSEPEGSHAPSAASREQRALAEATTDMQDSREAAEAFLRKSPVPYPHYFDPDASIARLFRGGRVSPTTAFYDARGELVFSHLGAYPDEDELESDIRRYALND